MPCWARRESGLALPGREGPWWVSSCCNPLWVPKMEPGVSSHSPQPSWGPAQYPPGSSLVGSTQVSTGAPVPPVAMSGTSPTAWGCPGPGGAWLSHGWAWWRRSRPLGRQPASQGVCAHQAPRPQAVSVVHAPGKPTPACLGSCSQAEPSRGCRPEGLQQLESRAPLPPRRPPWQAHTQPHARRHAQLF